MCIFFLGGGGKKDSNFDIMIKIRAKHSPKMQSKLQLVGRWIILKLYSPGMFNLEAFGSYM